MSLDSHKIKSADISTFGVVNAPDRLTGTAQQNKMIFDRLIREAVMELFNGLIDELAEESASVQASLMLKSNKEVTDTHIKSIALDAETGVFTFTREDGSFISIDTALEKVATNWQYDADTQSLVLSLVDGTTQRVPLSAFITETEFDDSESIIFSVSNHRVTASVREGCITEAMLSSTLIEKLREFIVDTANTATDAVRIAEAAAEGAVTGVEERLAGYVEAASDAREKAETSAGRAGAYAENASESMRAAERSKAAIEDMTVSSETLEPGSYARVEKSIVGDHVNLHYGIPRGDVGPQGATGPQGAQGVQGPEGPRGINGVAVATAGMYAFNVNEAGHLILAYTGDDTPDFSINAAGHLILTI